MKNLFDCVVVGTGPAGTICAQKMAKVGMSVLLLEQKKLPRNKPCTGMVPNSCIEIIEKEIGNFPRSLCVWPYEYKGCKYKVAKGVPVITATIGNDEVALSVKRSEFDYWLALEANKAGAELETECAFISIIEKSREGVTLKLLKHKHDGKREYVTVRTKYLVAADGMASSIRRTLFPERNYYLKSFSRQDYYIGECDLDPSYYHFFVYNTAIEQPVWFFNKDNFIVIGYAVASNDNLIDKQEKVLKYFIDEHGLKIKEKKHSEVCAEGINYTALKIKIEKLDFVYGCEEAPILFVGEAGEIVDSMSEGIYPALESGCYAAEAIIKHFKNADDNLLETYKTLSANMEKRIVDSWLNFWKKFGRFF